MASQPAPMTVPQYCQLMKDKVERLLRGELYKSAVRTATLGIDAAQHESLKLQIDLLNLRAEALLKLGRLQLALADGQNMIRTDITSHTGYIRSGQILQMEGRHRAALSTYQLGITHATDKTAIQEESYACEARFYESTRSDPIKLPPELLTMIFARLPVRVLTACCLVSRTWRRSIIADTRIWGFLDFPLRLRRADTERVQMCMRRAGESPCRILLAGSMDVGPDALRLQFTFPVGLRSLTLTPDQVVARHRPLPRLPILLEQLPQSLQALHIMVEASPRLLFAVLRGFPELRELRGFRVAFGRTSAAGALAMLDRYELRELSLLVDVHGGDSIPLARDMIHALVSKSPELATLQLRVNLSQARGEVMQRLDFQQASKLQRFSLCDSKMTAHPLLPAGVRVLEFSGNYFREPLSVGDLHLPRLQHFFCPSAHRAGKVSRYLDWLTENQRGAYLPLKSVDLSSNMVDRRESLLAFLRSPGVEQVTYLSLGDVPEVDNQILELVTRKFSALQVLDIEQAEVTGAAVTRLVMRRKETLKKLNLIGCTMNVNEDIVNFARFEGIEVLFFGPVKVRGKTLDFPGYDWEKDLRFM